MKKTASSLAYAAMMTALTVLLSWIAIPTPWGVPFTLQTLAVALCGYLLGIHGVSSVLCYLALGAVGVPVFSSFQGGIGALFGITGGYLFGFLPMVLLLGIAAKRRSSLLLLYSALGLAVCHLFGAFWFSRVGAVSFGKAFAVASLPYIWKDILSLILAYALAKHRLPKKNR